MIDPASVARRGCADAEAAIDVTTMLELCDEVAISEELEIAEILDDVDGFNVKTTLLDMLLLLPNVMVVPGTDALETEDETMADDCEALPVLTVPRAEMV